MSAAAPSTSTSPPPTTAASSPVASPSPSATTATAEVKKEAKMVYRNLGRSGLKVSVISIGAWVGFGNRIDDDAAFAIMKAAYDSGINFFDNAETYMAGKAELTMGRCLKRLAAPRSKLVISTKLYWGPDGGPNNVGLSRKHIIEGMKGSLERLGLEYVDVVFAHRPDPTVPMEEIVRAFNWLIEQGKTFYWGTSEWSAQQIEEANGVAARLHLIAPICEQPQYSMLHRTRVEVEYANLYRNSGLGLTVWSPLACGLLTGKYTSREFSADTRLGGSDKYAVLRNDLLNGEGMNGLEEKDFDSILRRVAALKPIAESLDCTLAQLALAWAIHNPHVSTAITGASSPAQLLENLKALTVEPKLTADVSARIEAVLANKPKGPKDWRGGW